MIFNREEIETFVEQWFEYQNGRPVFNDETALKNSKLANAEDILTYLKEMQREFDASQAWLKADSLKEIANIASEEFRMKNPDFPESVIEKFANKYAFNHR